MWLLGVQRSGTNLLTRSLKESMEIAVYSENHRRAFDEFRLRDDATIRALIERSRHRCVLFKPLCDIHRALDFWDTGTFSDRPSRIIWAYRGVDGRVRSTVARFGEVERIAMADLAAGDRTRWQALGLGPAQFALIDSFDWTHESVESAAALFWYLRNDLLLRLGLHERPRVTILSYERFVTEPQATMDRLQRFLGLTGRLPIESDGVRRSAPLPLELNPEIRRHCDELEERLATLVVAAASDEAGRLVIDH